jgi:hypothetical protein
MVCIGARESRGGLLLFLHADSTLLPGVLDQIRNLISSTPKIIGGNFRLIFDGDMSLSRWLTRLCAFIRFIGLYYGDSGIFVRRSIYEAVGGFRPIPLFEDLDLKKDILKARGYAWSPGEFGRPKCWYRDVSDADKAAEVSWL